MATKMVFYLTISELHFIIGLTLVIGFVCGWIARSAENK